MAATIKEIAQALSLSPSTVSIVLAGNAEKRKVAPKTRDRVLKAAEEMGYHPSLEARRLRAVQDGDDLDDDVIAIFWEAPLRETMLVRFLQGFQAYAAAHELSYTPSIYFYKAGHLKEQAKLFDRNKFHAAILYGCKPEDVAYLESTTFMGPKILVYPRYDPKNLTRCHLVTSNNAEFVGTYVNAFQQSGGTILTQCRSGYYQDDASFMAVLEANHMSYYDTDLAVGSIEGGYDWTMRYLKGREDNLPFDCIMAGSERMGFGVTRALEDLGIRVPSQVRVIAADVYNLNFQEFSRPKLSSVDMAIEKTAECSIQILQSVVGSASPEPKVVYVERKYTARESC